MSSEIAARSYWYHKYDKKLEEAFLFPATEVGHSCNFMQRKMKKAIAEGELLNAFPSKGSLLEREPVTAKMSTAKSALRSASVRRTSIGSRGIGWANNLEVRRRMYHPIPLCVVVVLSGGWKRERKK